jgi:hypothetical protein
MTRIKIGDYARRPGKRTHKIESIIAGDAITKCGRRLTDELGELIVDEVTAVNACLICFRPS